MKKRFKKRYFIGIILLLIGGYWLSQNLWVFEKQIPESEYGEFLTDTTWYGKNRKMSFNKNQNYRPKNFPNSVWLQWAWFIENDVLYTVDGNINSDWKILAMSQNFLKLKLRSGLAKGYTTLLKREI